MKIICAGYWKTGTKSLAEALRILGYKVYDYDDQFYELGDLWEKFYNGTVTDVEIYSSLKDIDVLIDGSVIAFWEEIHKVFPEAKIILTTRDEDSWYKSYRNMFSLISGTMKIRFILARVLPLGRKFMKGNDFVINFCNGVDAPFTLLPMFNPRLFKLKFRKHNSYVLHQSPKDKLLVHQSEDGWPKLCEFLGHDVPGQPYPLRNKAGSHLSFEEGPLNPQFQQFLRQSQVCVYIMQIILACAACYVISRYFY